MHLNDITKRIMDAYGVNRAGSRITSAVEEAVSFGHRMKLFRHRKGFVYSLSDQTIKVRDRSQLDMGERKIEFVAPAELGRATSKIAGVFEDRLNALIASGRLMASDGRFILGSSEPNRTVAPDGSKLPA